MSRITLTLGEILDRYYYKDWVQDELRDVALPTSGDKEELIGRFLNSKAARRDSVDELGKRLVQALRVTELRQIAEHVGSTTQGGREEILRGILDSVVFEPFVKHTRRHCRVCARERLNELHFGVDWKANYFICEVCGTKSPVQEARAKGVPVEETELPVFVQMVENQRDEISHRAAAFAIAISVVCMFLAVAVPMTLAYGWVQGTILGLVFTIAAGFLLIMTRGFWEPRLMKWIQ